VAASSGHMMLTDGAGGRVPEQPPARPMPLLGRGFRTGARWVRTVPVGDGLPRRQGQGGELDQRLPGRVGMHEGHAGNAGVEGDQQARHPSVVHQPGTNRIGSRLAHLPDAQLPAAKPRAGSRRWLPDIQPPTPDTPAGVGGQARAHLVDHQPRPQGHHPGIDRDGLPGARSARGRDPLARVAAHLEAAKQDCTSTGCAGRRTRGGRPGGARRRGRERVCVAAGRQEDPTGDSAEQRRGQRPQAASVSSADHRPVWDHAGRVRP
jgi:hypothetical protein